MIVIAPELFKYYKDSKRFIVIVSDVNGPVSNKSVNITINGVTYTRITDDNGTASLAINLFAGEYLVVVVVDDVVVYSRVVVLSTINADDVEKVFRNATQYSATFVDVNGTPAANISVSFNINGVIYNRLTDENGTAKLNINLNPGEYILTATNLATGDMKSNVIKVLSLIESSDLTKFYKNASQFVVRIRGADGSYVGEGEKITFNINGVLYVRTTNSTGHASLNINLNPEKYVITTEYKGCYNANNVTVLPVLTAEDLRMKYKDGSKFTAKLVDGQGNAYPNQSVTFNVHGVIYTRTTDANGEAKLNINLMPGEYIITSGFNGLYIGNKITISG